MAIDMVASSSDEGDVALQNVHKPGGLFLAVG